MKVYLAGPMTGYPEHNCTTFDEVRNTLRRNGHTVISPPDIIHLLGDDPRDVETNGTPEKYALYMRLDLQFVAQAEAIVLLPGWERSRGAKTEFLVAQTLGIPVYTLSGFMEQRPAAFSLVVNVLP